MSPVSRFSCRGEKAIIEACYNSIRETTITRETKARNDHSLSLRQRPLFPSPVDA